MLEKGMQRLSCLYDKFTQLWGMYRNALKIPVEQLTSKPRPTGIFMVVPQYNKIFVRIHQWFSFGIYDFAKENYMLSFIKISSLYESYLLAKMVAYFTDRSYTLIDKKDASIQYPEDGSTRIRIAQILMFSSTVNTISHYIISR